MTDQKFTQADWDEVSDNPEWTEEDFRNARPFAEVFSHLAATIGKRGPQKKPTKVSTTLRLSPDVVAHFRATGKGWQARIDQVLKDWVASH
ncbi:BrnA antitoxin family protein [Novosphingobium cyanobacteriorum]|uniref:BrnA antitoxin family protein n=1 Tax=Novosphingobium cyanobacteriorum TaxID=3024215 RepID=A0ABT6CKR3_9SPHN|nr:BrnA antitoxin family protein [Novosphingobium cyanobacteriorum]MDF8334099.1 BrnA antitoxin family protein [Novosphingobium cyanobacteriorum]